MLTDLYLLICSVYLQSFLSEQGVSSPYVTVPLETV